jgi:hypothetical protein
MKSHGFIPRIGAGDGGGVSWIGGMLTGVYLLCGGGGVTFADASPLVVVSISILSLPSSSWCERNMCAECHGHGVGLFYDSCLYLSLRSCLYMIIVVLLYNLWEREKRKPKLPRFLAKILITTHIIYATEILYEWYTLNLRTGTVRYERYLDSFDPWLVTSLISTAHW